MLSKCLQISMIWYELFNCTEFIKHCVSAPDETDPIFGFYPGADYPPPIRQAGGHMSLIVYIY